MIEADVEVYIILEGQDRQSTMVMRRLAKEDKEYSTTIRVQSMDRGYNATTIDYDNSQ